MQRVVIIGNGAAGNSAAETLRCSDPDVEIIMAAAENLPEYSACALPDYLSAGIKREKLFIKTRDEYDAMGISTMFGTEIRQIDAGRHMLLHDNGELVYDRLILATGSRSFIPPVQGSVLEGNFMLKTVSDIDSIITHNPRRVLVVGSGNIGIEAAEAMHERGCEVTVIELMDRILPKIFDRESSERIAPILSAKGINILTGEKVLEITGTGRVQGAVTDSRVIGCDTVIWAAGVKQNVELATAAGIKTGELGGITVNQYMQTTMDSVYACGDCIETTDILTGYPCLSLLWPNAKKQAQVAALNCIGIKTVYEGSVSFVAEDIFGTTAVSMGLTSDAMAGKGVEIIEGSDDRRYWRILVTDDRIMGMQTIGVTSGLGAVMAMMKRGILLSEFHRTVEDPLLLRKAGWYLPAMGFLRGDNALQRDAI